MQKDKKIYVGWMLESIALIREYTRWLNEEQFEKNNMVHDACLMQFQHLWETANKLKTNFPEDTSLPYRGNHMISKFHSTWLRRNRAGWGLGYNRTRYPRARRKSKESTVIIIAMQRFFFTNLTPSHSLSIHDEWFVHQISRVLRSRLGDEITLFNGDWYDYRYRIASIEKKNITLELVSSEKNQAEPSLFIHLYQALPNKYEKIEYIIQKGVEIGISQFTFFFSERSQKLVISNKKIERFQEITREALEQCGGNSMPTITFLEKGGIPRSEWNSFVLHTKSADSFPLNSLANEGKAECSLNCYIWPEGGWSDQEMKTFADMRIKSIHLGNRILRTETAGSAVAFFLLQSGGFLTQDQK